MGETCSREDEAMTTQRNKRRLRLVLAAALIGWIVTLGGLVSWRVSVEEELTGLRAELDRTKAALQSELDRKKEREDAARRAVEAALGEAVQLLKKLEWEKAQAVLLHADQLLPEKDEELRQRLHEVQNDLRLMKQLDDIRLEATTLPTSDAAYREALWNWGLAPLEGDDEDV